MRILMLSWEYPPNVVGGMGRHVAELAPSLAQQGHKVHVVTPVAKENMAGISAEDGLMVHRVLTPAINPSSNIFSQARQTNEAIENYLRRLSQQEGQCDLIHVHDWLTGFAGLALQNAWHCPLVATVHATEKGRYRGHINNSLQQSIDQAERELVSQARRVVVCSHHMKDEVQYFFQIPDRKLDVIPNGVDLAELANKHNPKELATFRLKYASPEEKIVFTISRLVYEKGVHLLIQAMPQVLRECPRVRLIVAGKGPEMDNLTLQAQNSGIANQVSFIGFISDKERNLFFEVADCAIFASLYEPFGIVALEAMALGCPLIVSDVGGFSEVVKHAETGIKIYPNNVDSTAWGIVHALNNPNWAQEHTLKAQRSIQEKFNWPRIAALTLETYRRALNDSNEQ